ncbi:hypothetical protein J4G33_16385 [Actinotalea sp. BY-33]|uniref:Uncharacterized protein n=1 Tax=Actinotalea soli TaxID=2819234 RepID=A0A939LSP0_9CELL|nr:hypothetical protein [Actinotalea soli]MBO1753388.1 hypothetical protein [Actinotalea soli]
MSLPTSTASPTPTRSTPRPATPSHRSGYRTGLRWLLQTHGFMFLWALGMLVVLVAAATIIVSNVTTPAGSIVQHARQGLTWFPFSIAIVGITTYTNIHIGAGLTRRSLGWAALTAAVVMAVAYAALFTLALQLERAVYGWTGWAHGVDGAGGLFTSSGQVGLVVLDVGLLFLAGQLSGVLVGIVYYRAGGWWGTLALPLTAGPILLATPALSTAALGDLGLAPRVVLVLLVLGAMSLAAHRLILGVQVRKLAT